MAETPAVTAILPTRGRRELALQAVACFLAQTYHDKELVIVDDRDDPSLADVIGLLENIRYYAIDGRRRIAAKRNIACRYAAGDIIWHLDSDDWSHPCRMADQVERLRQSGKAVTGYHSILFYGETCGLTKYIGRPSYAIGTSLCYRRDWWIRSPFREHLTIGEDKIFADAAADAGQLASVDGGNMVVARIHAGNTASKKPATYLQLPLSDLPEGFRAHAGR